LHPSHPLVAHQPTKAAIRQRYGANAELSFTSANAPWATRSRPQFGPLRTFVMGGFDHHNHTILVGVRRARRYYSNYKAEFTIAAPSAAYKQVHKYTGINFPLIGMSARAKNADRPDRRPPRAVRPQSGGSRAMAAASDRHAARLVFQSESRSDCGIGWQRSPTCSRVTRARGAARLARPGPPRLRAALARSSPRSRGTAGTIRAERPRLAPT
jgi:hypothetical protein